MSQLRLIAIVLFVWTIMGFGAEFGELFSLPGSQKLVSTAEARIGRPLTPVSVAGAARRTVRRCAVGVYNCGIPGIQPLDTLALVRTYEPLHRQDNQLVIPSADQDV